LRNAEQLPLPLPLHAEPPLMLQPVSPLPMPPVFAKLIVMREPLSKHAKQLLLKHAKLLLLPPLPLPLPLPPLPLLLRRLVAKLVAKLPLMLSLLLPPWPLTWGCHRRGSNPVGRRHFRRRHFGHFALQRHFSLQTRKT
jgi:hypothetical protein